MPAASEWNTGPMAAFDLSRNPIHLGLGASAHQEPEFSGDMAWYGGYADRHADDGVEGRLVAVHAFTEDWDSWEMHPQGHEAVICVSGAMTLIQEIDGERIETPITAGQAAINEPGVWHTATVVDQATAIFITAGLGTEHRPL